LLLRDRALARPLAGAGIGARPLTVHRQIAPMPRTAVAADFHQPLDVHRDLFPEVAFDAGLLFNHPADLPDIVLRQILEADVGTDAGVLEDPVRAMPPDAVDIREPDLDPTRAGKINTS